MDAVAVVCYVKSGKCWRVSDSIFNLRTCFFGRASNYDLKQRCVRQQKFRSPEKILDIFSDNAFLSRGI
ncbi:hypothetical protein EC23916_A0329 [Escherichia coli 2.3916]|nr:hypothetical protein EC23916_A0329 [Escherichia coli 2.3916]